MTMRKEYLPSKLWLILCMAICAGALTPVSAQRRDRDRDYQAIERAQTAIRARIERDEGRDANVRFNDDAQSRFSSNSEMIVTGTGTVFQRDERRRNFTYEAYVNNRNYNVRNQNYRYSGGWGGGGGNYPGGNRPGDNRPGGNYPGGNRPGGNYPGGGDWGDRPTGRTEFSGAIVNRNSDKGLDVSGGSRQDGVPIQQWTFAGQRNQSWNLIQLRNGEYAIASQGSGKVLDVSGFSTENGAPVQQYSWSGRENQRWRLEPTGRGFYRIINVNSGKCLDVRNKSREDGAEVHQWDCRGDSSQEWRVGGR
jgi:hypothetical protein